MPQSDPILNGRRSLPLLRLLLYYGALIMVGALLMQFVPGFANALAAPFTAPPAGQVDDLLRGGHPSSAGATLTWAGLGGRAMLTLTSVTGALLLAIPVAWVLMITRRLRYDPSLVHTVLILPIVVAGVVLVVKNSLALAFALAAIVAGVRFRQKLDEPEQVAYVLLALGIGLAAGVQALDVALVTSLAFNVVMLTLWRYNPGSISSRGKGAQLAMGDLSLLRPSVKEAKREMQKLDKAFADGLEPDGFLVVRTSNPTAARRIIEIAVQRVASEWRTTEPVAEANDMTRFGVMLRLKKKADPAELIAELDERWSKQISAAEYVSLGKSSSDGS